MALAIPTTIEEVDAAWLTKALGQRDPGVEVKNATVLESLGGACTKLRMALETNRPGYPKTVIVKGCFEPHSQSMRHMQVLETNIYNRVAPQLDDVQTVEVLFADGDAERGAALVLEDLDLRGVRCLKALVPIEDYALAARFVDKLAKLHSHWWGAPNVQDDGEFGWIARAGIDYSIKRIVDPVVKGEMLSRPRGAAAPRMVHDGERLIRASAAMFALGEGEPMVLSHGDPHPSNLFVDAEGGAGFLDWTCFRTPWIHDVAYFIAGALDVVERRRWEKRLLEHYLERLAVYGAAAPDFERAWLAYRRWQVYGLMVWLWNIPEYHTESMITAMTVRYAAAVVELDTFGALGV